MWTACSPYSDRTAAGASRGCSGKPGKGAGAGLRGCSTSHVLSRAAHLPHGQAAPPHLPRTLTDVLVNCFRSVLALRPTAEVVQAAYLAVGKIAPDYEGAELNVSLVNRRDAWCMRCYPVKGTCMLFGGRPAQPHIHGALLSCDEHGVLLRPPSLQVGGSTVSKAIVAASGVNEARLRCVRRVHCAYLAQPLLRVDECLKWCRLRAASCSP